MTEKLLLLVGVTTLCMLSPGPDMFLVMRNTLAGGRWHGLLTAVGVLTGNLVHIGYCVFGVAVLLLRSQPAYNAMRIASALCLVFLGIQSFRQPEAGVPATDRPRAARWHSAYWQGLWNNLLNPKGSLFYLGVFTQLITPDVSIPQTMLLVTVMMTVSALFWLLFVWTLQMPMVGRRLSQSAVLINRMLGVVLILFAVTLAIRK
jgi:threonine/homoserine/homoserine lactone efflux protein